MSSYGYYLKIHLGVNQYSVNPPHQVRTVTAVLKMLKCAGLKVLKNQTPVKSKLGLSHVKIGGFFHDSGHCTRSGIKKRLEKHQ